MSKSTKTITPKELAAELEICPKVLRGWMRKNHGRAAEVKHSRWVIDAELAKAARERFSR